MGCDTLGPRGDEKNGCHGDWLAYCASLKKSSQPSSFRSNRFNNLFASAAGLVYHQQDILHFFELRKPSNLKQKSVLADASCQKLNTMLLGLALMFVYITGPFWIFVRSEIHYFDQYTFIQPMREILKGMSEHPEMILQEGSIPDELNAFCIRNEPAAEAVCQAREELPQDHRHLLEMVIKGLAGEFVIALERQLADFLPGGKYGSAPTEEDRQRMAHCQLTNQVGEACFADLDYTMFRNRHASLHHHSTLNMLKRNETISKWLNSKPKEEKMKLLSKARKFGPRMREQNRQQELIVLQELQADMERKRREGEEMQQRRTDKLRKQKKPSVM